VTIPTLNYDGRLPCQTAPQLFDAPDGERTNSTDRHHRVYHAQLLCSRCPVRAACGDLGEQLGEQGVWGGRDRSADTPEPKPAPVPRSEAQCGTEPGEKKHRRAGEKPCFACAEAARIAGRERKAKRSLAAAA